MHVLRRVLFCTVPVRNVLCETDCHFTFVFIYTMRQTQQETVIICFIVYKVHVERPIYRDPCNQFYLVDLTSHLESSTVYANVVIQLHVYVCIIM